MVVSCFQSCSSSADTSGFKIFFFFNLSFEKSNIFYRILDRANSMSTTKLGYVHSITKIISLGFLNVLSLQKSINPTGFEKITLYGYKSKYSLYSMFCIDKGLDSSSSLVTTINNISYTTKSWWDYHCDHNIFVKTLLFKPLNSCH